MTTAKRAACIVGWPVKHSRSPKLHGYWIERYRIDGEYRMEEVRPEDFPSFLENLAANGYVGCNVTIPHKEAAFALSQTDERARAVGAANTLYLDGGRLRSTNTDVEGFIGALDAAAPGWAARTKAALVLGAGGGGRGVVYGLIERGIATIHVVNRSYDKAVALRDRFGSRVHPARWEDIAMLLPQVQLLAQTTSLGMKGQPELSIDLGAMPAGSVVSDIVYVPLKTPLLEQAERRGFKTSNGLDMLLHQAVRGFELWFGVRPQVTDELRELLVRDIVGG